MRHAAIVLLAQLYRLYFATLRVVVVLPDGTRATPATYPFGPEIFALTERDAAALAGIMAGRRFTVLVAPGRDGDWAATALETLGCAIVRGSSRRGGLEALIELTGNPEIARGPVAVVADGPLGPAGVAKAGAGVLAARTRRPLRALGAAARRQVTLNATWAQIYVPLPFTRVTVALEAISPERTMPGGRDRAACADRLTSALARARRRALDLVHGSPETVPMRQSCEAGSRHGGTPGGSRS